MAVVRARSAPPYATIIFVFLWVISTGIAIWMAVQKGDAEKKAADAIARATAASNNTSAATNDVKRLAKWIDENAKNADDAATTAEKTLKDAGKNKVMLAQGITELATYANELEKTKKELEAQKTDLEQKLTQAYKAKVDSEASMKASIDAQLDQSSKSSAQATKERADKEALLAKAQADLTKATADFDTEQRRLKLEIAAKDQDIATRDGQIVKLKQQIAASRGTGGIPLVGIEPAGTIIRARPGTSECYINLGRKDRVVPQLTFSIHDPRVGVKLSADTELTPKTDADVGGKGGLEVIEVGENESLCRVTFLKKGQTVQQGDLIANMIYQHDRARKLHFVVFGDFDLDGDGVATATEHDRLVRMITGWGGVVDDNLTAETDYLVLGVRPATPNAKGASDAGGVVPEQIAKQKLYDDLFTEAKRASVPILNANRFLAFIGYYSNTVNP